MHNRVGIMHNDYSISHIRRADLSRDPLIFQQSIVSGTQIYIITQFLDPRPGEERYIPQALENAPESTRTHFRILSQLIVLARNGRYSRYRSMLISILTGLLERSHSYIIRIGINGTVNSLQ